MLPYRYSSSRFGSVQDSQWLPLLLLQLLLQLLFLLLLLLLPAITMPAGVKRVRWLGTEKGKGTSKAEAIRQCPEMAMMEDSKFF
jgi:hypothetical protein